jgi:hypothetical protein
MSKIPNKLLKVVPAASGLHGTPVSAPGLALASPILRQTNHQIVRPLAKRYVSKDKAHRRNKM